MTTYTQSTNPNNSSPEVHGGPVSGGTLAGQFSQPFIYPAKTILWLSWGFCLRWAWHVGLNYTHKYSLRNICVKRGVKVGPRFGAPAKNTPVDRLTFELFITGKLPPPEKKQRRIYRTKSQPRI